MKKVYLEPTWKMHVGYKNEVAPYPPEGYEYIFNEKGAEKVFRLASKINFSSLIQSKMSALLPLHIIKARLEGFFKRPPKGTDLTCSLGHLVFRKEPWVIEILSVYDPVAPNIKQFLKYKWLVERLFASEYCKGVICLTEFTKKTVLSNLDCTQFEQKIKTVLPAVHPKQFTKSYNNEKVTLLFMGSANLAGEFEMRGGKEVLEAFIILSEKYRNLELVIRSDISKQIKKRYQKVLSHPNLTLVEDVIPYQQLEQIYTTADIFLIPGHYDVWLITLEAMSYELPVISSNTSYGSELVDDGNTGFIIKTSELMTYYHQENLPLPLITQSSIQNVDPKVVKDIVEKTSILIENPDLRRTMGKKGRWKVEEDSFSLKRRNEKLEGIFNEAIASSIKSS